MKKINIQIRSAQENDAEAISEINLLCWKTAYRGLLDDSVLDNLSLTPNRLERFKDGIRHIPIYLCAIYNNKVLGYIAAGTPHNKILPHPFEVYYLYVHPDYQHQGIGQILMASLKEKIKGADFCLYALDGNQKALSFYQKQGGIRHPEFDTDNIVIGLKMHDLFLSFANYKMDKKGK